MSTNHNHAWHGCEHHHLAFCKHCQVPYCKDCGKEWNSHSYWNAQTAYLGTLQPYLTRENIVSTTNSPQAVNTSTICNHLEKSCT